MVKKDEPKKLLIPCTTKEYSDFWYIGSLLGKSKKKEIFLEMITFIKEYKEKNE